MDVQRVTANLQVRDIEEARDFYTGFLGLAVEEFNLGWVARFTSPVSGACVQLVTHDATSPATPAISVHARDVDSAHRRAIERGYSILRPPTTESWGVHRFLVRAPDGHVVNIVEHR